MLNKVNAFFVGGVIGALVDSFNIWFLGKIGFTSFIGVGLHPQFTMRWLYPRLVWGGIWGLLFLLPIMKRQIYLRGMLFSLVPTLMMFFVVFPEMGKGYYGLGFGTLTPLLVLLLNFIWGIVVSLWKRYSLSY